MNDIEIDDEKRQKVRNRLARARGQIDAVIRMLDEDGQCLDIISQMTAATKAVDKATSSMIFAGLECCYKEDIEGDKREKLEKLFMTL
ncbi:MAG: metal-sensitive transcriptional regulator [Actinomycetaceae bacterium]|nr:metal-sensitive transcriptional regulator [Actinomycetaceae bacterium]